ncbi:MAG: uroporphyrinogen-III synthase, partial [Dehalococcoidia bacterium]|nr:uroporphyrinogen-III synthase [Dehalococcoidia bacterium]
AEHQAKELSQLLLSRGALPVHMPVIAISPPRSWRELDRAMRNLKSYGWIIFTSVNAVEIFWERLYILDLDSRWLAEAKVGAIGPATAGALEEKGIHPDYVPEVYTSQGFLAGFKKKGIAGCKVLLPRADIADNEISNGLAGLGAEIQQVTAYRTTAAARSVSPARRMLLKGEIDVITFTSASTVNNLLAMLGQKWEVIKQAKLACIGPKTAAVLIDKDIKPDIVAPEHTMSGLVAAIEHYFQGKGE